MTSATPSRSELRFAAFLTYCSRRPPPTVAIKASRDLMLQVKENRIVEESQQFETGSAFVGRRLREVAPDFIDEFLGADTALIPMPTSGLRKPYALWPALEIVSALRAEGFGAGVASSLRRWKAVPKAALAQSGERPTARTHYDSLVLDRPLALPPVVTLVDDVITRGSQMLGAAWCIWKARPDVTVRAFAVIRTISDETNFVKILDPCVGQIELRRGLCYRRP